MCKTDENNGMKKKIDKLVVNNQKRTLKKKHLKEGEEK